MKYFLSFMLFFIVTLSYGRVYLGTPSEFINIIPLTGERTLLYTSHKKETVNAFVFDSDPKFFAAAVTRGKKQFVVTPNFTSPAYDEIVQLYFLSVIKKPIYTSRTGEKYNVNVGETRYGPYSYVNALSVSNNDQFMAFQVKVGDQVSVVFQGEKGNDYDSVGYPLVTNKGHYAYTATKGEQKFLVIDGVETNQYLEYGLYSYGELGEELYFLAKTEEGWVVVKDNTVITEPYELIDLLTVADDGSAYMASVSHLDENFVLINGKKTENYQNIINLFLSANASRYAYGIIKQSQGGYVVDGIEEGLYDDLYLFSFSANSQHYRYFVKTKGKWQLINNGIPEENYQTLYSPITQSDDGSLFCFWVLYQGQLVLVVKSATATQHYQDVSYFRFNENRLFAVQQEGQNFYTIEIKH